MDKNVLIHIRGLQMMEPTDEQEPIELVVPGQYYFKNGSHYLRYEELMDETSTEPTVNYIKISSKAVEVRKKGLVNVHMVFEQGKEKHDLLFYPLWNCGNGNRCNWCNDRGKRKRNRHEGGLCTGNE